MSDIIRRIIDILVSLLAMIVLSPLLLLIALAVYFTSPGGVLYRSKRTGKNERTFTLYKFRSMVSGADKMGAFNVAHTDARVTPVGRFLRTTKLDEFPQFINVFIGNMTLIGPRPDILEYKDKMPEKSRNIIFSAKPGLSDWASLFTFNQYADFAKTENPDEFHLKHIYPIKIALQEYYCKNRTLLMDLHIFVMTALRIIKIDLGFPKYVKDIIDRQTALQSQ
ncbi:glycosyl transferase [Planctomycetales bacterium]|nr:glycosyl transferase [Planctomycetales bacterium]